MIPPRGGLAPPRGWMGAGLGCCPHARGALWPLVRIHARKQLRWLGGRGRPDAEQHLPQIACGGSALAAAVPCRLRLSLAMHWLSNEAVWHLRYARCFELVRAGRGSTMTEGHRLRHVKFHATCPDPPATSSTPTPEVSHGSEYVSSSHFTKTDARLSFEVPPHFLAVLVPAVRARAALCRCCSCACA